MTSDCKIFCPIDSATQSTSHLSSPLLLEKILYKVKLHIEFTVKAVQIVVQNAYSVFSLEI